MDPKVETISRRRFIARTLQGGTALLLAVNVPGCSRDPDAVEQLRQLYQVDEAFFPNAFLRIEADGRTVVQIPSSEMGQGVQTALAMLIAEELNADWEQIAVDTAPVNSAYINPRHGRQATGSSASIRGFFLPMRQAAAAAREMLVAAAAQQWSVPARECYAAGHRVYHRGTRRSVPFGNLITLAGRIPVPEQPSLKSARHFRLIGRSPRRVDALAKLTGQARFGQDIRLPGMLVAVLARPPVFGATLKDFDPVPALAVPGVRHVVAIDRGVAVVADHFWAAYRGREVLVVHWDDGELAQLDSARIRSQLKTAVTDGKTVEERGEPSRAFAEAAHVIEAEYTTPFLAHACMEPMNCTAWVHDERCEIWAPTQAPQRARETAARHLDIDVSKIQVHTTFLGGGFGRRSEQDFVVEAVEISKALRLPVKVLWTREDDIRHDFFRPASFHRLSAAFDHQRRLTAWRHQFSSPSILQRLVPAAGLIFRGKDPTSVEGAVDLPYAITNTLVRYAQVDSGVPVGFWRSVGHSQNSYAVECFIDEIAHFLKEDPLQFRYRHLSHDRRYISVLERVADLADWNSPLPAGHGRGLAVVKSFGSYVAQVAEVSVEPDTPAPALRVHRIACAVDCGLVIHPDIVRQQMEGGIIFGLTAALYGDITLAEGRVTQSNFHDYPLLRLPETPRVDVAIVPSAEAPEGIGEVGVPPVAPAVANAVFRATGRPVRDLPIRVQYLRSPSSIR